MSESKTFGMRISQLLDKTTVVITGEGIERLKTGGALHVLALGVKTPEMAVPLVIPKADLVVDAVTRYYVIAKTPEYETTINTGLGLSMAEMFQKKVWKREPLRVDEKLLVGNPALGSVKPGDPVVPTNEISEFVDYVASKGD